MESMNQNVLFPILSEEEEEELDDLDEALGNGRGTRSGGCAIALLCVSVFILLCSFFSNSLGF